MDVKKTLRLPVSELRWTCDPDSLGYESIEEVEMRQGIIGQDRAINALKLGIRMRNKGYNIFVAGASGTGRTTTVQHALATTDNQRSAPPDIVIVNNFRDPDRPRPIHLPNGQGRKFHNEMRDFVETFRTGLKQLALSEEVKERRSEVVNQFQVEEKELVSIFEAEVKEKHFALIQIQVGPHNRPEVAPLIAGDPVPLEKLEGLVAEGKFAEEELVKYQEVHEQLRGRLEETFRGARAIHRRLRDALETLQKDFAKPLLTHSLAEIDEAIGNPEVSEHLKSVESEILSNLSHFLEEETDDAPAVPLDEDERFRPFLVNVLVDNKGNERAPVIVETSPNYRALFGTIEKVVDRTGVWRSDFLHIKAGSVLRGHGGFLVLQMNDVLSEQGVWPALMRTLKNRRIDIQSFEPMVLVSASAIQPEPIEIDIRVIVVGNNNLYYTLDSYDPDFRNVFKVKADFDSVMLRNDENIQRYSTFIRNVTHSENLLPLDKTGVARVLEYGARLSGRSKKLSTLFSSIADLLREATYWAREEDAELVVAAHVARAIAEKEQRVDLPEEKLQEAILDGVIHVQVDGGVVGQVNGLAVYDMGDHRFGKPSRITAQTSLGQSGIVSIERESEMSGRSFNKAILILDGFFRSRFGQTTAISLSASVAFEQSYGDIDGDSASVAEVCALISSVAEIPLDQGIAITGSIDQKGRVQAIGGANEKVEGFYAVCKSQGLTGNQGAMIPKTNISDLMLREELVSVCETGKFAVYGIETVDQALEIMTGVPAGQRNEDDGSFPEGTIFRRVEDKLTLFAERMKEQNRPDSEGEAEQGGAVADAADPDAKKEDET